MITQTALLYHNPRTHILYAGTHREMITQTALLSYNKFIVDTNTRAHTRTARE